MLAADQLLVLLAEGTRNIADRMAAAGFTEEEVRGAWNFARNAGWGAPTGLGADKITEAGRARAQRLRCRPENDGGWGRN